MINSKALGFTSVKKNKIAIEYIDINDLLPNTYNPNVHEMKSFNQLIKSVAVFGFTQPIVVDRKTMQIIDGEHRWRVAAVLDIKKIPVVFLDLTPEQMRLATIIHNSARGKHSTEMLDEIYNKMEAEGFNISKELLEDL